MGNSLSYPFIHASMNLLPHLPTHSHLPALAFPYIGSSNTLRLKGFSSHRCPIRSSSATFAASAMGPFVCIVGWWSSCRELPPRGCKPPQLLQSLLQLLHQSQSDDWLQASTSVFVRLWQSFSGDSYIRLLSAYTSGTHNFVCVW